MDVERWVDDRLRSLDIPAPRVSADTVLMRWQKREARRRVVRRRLTGLGIATALTCVAFASVITLRSLRKDYPALPEAPRAMPEIPVSQPQPSVVPPEIRNEIALAAPEPRQEPAPRAPAVAAPVLNANFKEIGSPSASIAFEIYTDYECPPCATFYRDTVPLLIAQYVDTGKVRLLRRDFPLNQHRHAMLAARFADAAGLIGQFQAVADRIFQTQSQWAQDGDIDRQVAAVLPPEEMARLREVMKDTHRLDEMIEHDRALAADDHIDQTPTVVLAANGVRRRIVNLSSFAALKESVDEMLMHRQ